MYYEINVTKQVEENGHVFYRHYFATAERSMTSFEKLTEVYNHFLCIFPTPTYKVTASKRQYVSKDITNIIEV